MVALHTGSKLRLLSRDPRPLLGHPSSLLWGIAGLVFQHSWEPETAIKVLSPCLPQPALLQQGRVPGGLVPVNKEPDRQTHVARGEGTPCPHKRVHCRCHGWGFWVPIPMLRMGIKGQHQLGRMASGTFLGLRFLFCKVRVMLTPTLEGCRKVSLLVAARPGGGAHE